MTKVGDFLDRFYKLLHRSKYLTLIESGQRGILPSKLQSTKIYERDKDITVKIDGYEEN